MRRVTDNFTDAGFTLMEMLVSIVIAGILIALVGMFGRWQIQSYLDISSRAALADAADTALRRLTRELQSALPNSVRVDASGTFLEFIPIRDAGRYRAESFLSGTAVLGDPLDFNDAADTTFDVLGPGVKVNTDDQLVVYNLGIPRPAGTLSGTDAYEGDNRRTIPAGGTGAARTSILFTPRTVPAPLALPFASPGNRFHIVSNPVTFQCDHANRGIRRYWNYGFHSPQATDLAVLGAGLSAVLVDNVQGCSFTYTPGASQRNGLLSINLTLEANGETVSLMNQVEILNTP